MIDILKKYQEIITSYDIHCLDYELLSYRIKTDIILIDDSKLIVKDYLFINNVRKYSYHWQNKYNQLIIRWDNAPHWKLIETFPYHKHNFDEKNIEPSKEVSLEDVLEYIKKELILLI